MSEEPVLLLVLSDPVGVDGRTRWFDRKTISGLRMFAQGWPGRIVVSAPSSSGGGTALGEAVPSDELEFDLLLDRAPSDAAALVDPAVVLALHAPANYALSAWDPTRTVFTLENGLRQRLRVELLQARSALSRARITAGIVRRAPAFHRSIRRAAGVQCNGYASWSAHRHLSRSPMLFFDHRVPGEVIAASRAVEPSTEAPIRLGFSGRHIPIKGPHHAVRLVAELRARGLDATMTMYGDGALRPEIERAAGPGVTLAGALPFAEEWIPSVRENVDLMVLPYPQADPAGTYLESFALGVPVLGFAHEAFSPFARDHGAGWEVPVGDTAALADTVQELGATPQMLTAAGTNALDFMRCHASEDEFAARVAHLRDVAQV
ncbi:MULTISPECIES: glycosyltransferase [Brachybacterium]|uniref:D-inositol 3-phosphate glycosyltransferase n=1 Tax=Brachybacterium alimentarium TaxID=47845 RepID=A0A2A3YK37_9MICO|nr:glycosyltransferase [Brachybacterium alimentarium]PCC39716.1 hypothetical protein CIK66_06975 [Brachybacterium alimentarium]RCS64902.1 glycosyltransferase [Brachybacterium alimentarium]RCS71587.1 glycosyltransferase [Brachybacterium alimentarium]RCS82425.1 glycosyltransferase [Brachybacterium alimentarium]